MRTALSRMEREGVQRRAARDCPPHPPERAFWQSGGYDLPDKLVCGRCYTTLEVRWPSRRGATS